MSFHVFVLLPRGLFIPPLATFAVDFDHFALTGSHIASTVCQLVSNVIEFSTNESCSLVCYFDTRGYPFFDATTESLRGAINSMNLL